MLWTTLSHSYQLIIKNICCCGKWWCHKWYKEYGKLVPRFSLFLGKGKRELGNEYGPSTRLFARFRVNGLNKNVWMFPLILVRLYSHCTLRSALALIVTFSPFSAKHQYRPDWYLVVWNLSMFPVPTVLLSLTHVMLGTGLPLALQWNVTVSFSTTVRFWGLVMKLGRTAMRWIRKHLRNAAKGHRSRTIEHTCMARTNSELSLDYA